VLIDGVLMVGGANQVTVVSIATPGVAGNAIEDLGPIGEALHVVTQGLQLGLE
jgi:hypothetical protein